ncbi:hypothetical protein Pfo_018413 [Paulownia fortunei]|nr:hypothetical protein Pfo_018413 [Paulownia fortunei]
MIFNFHLSFPIFPISPISIFKTTPHLYHPSTTTTSVDNFVAEAFRQPNFNLQFKILRRNKRKVHQSPRGVGLKEKTLHRGESTTSDLVFHIMPPFNPPQRREYNLRSGVSHHASILR